MVVFQRSIAPGWHVKEENNEPEKENIRAIGNL